MYKSYLYLILILICNELKSQSVDISNYKIEYITSSDSLNNKFIDTIVVSFKIHYKTLKDFDYELNNFRYDFYYINDSINIQLTAMSSIVIINNQIFLQPMMRRDIQYRIIDNLCYDKIPVRDLKITEISFAGLTIEYQDKMFPYKIIYWGKYEFHSFFKLYYERKKKLIFIYK
jgi:hypothetical protein